MAKPKQQTTLSMTKRPPATTPEARELELVAKTFDLVERRIDEGTASAQETMHFLKLGSKQSSLELRKLEGEIELQKARIEQIESQAKMEEMFSKAIDAMISYQGGNPEQVREFETGDLFRDED